MLDRLPDSALTLVPTETGFDLVLQDPQAGSVCLASVHRSSATATMTEAIARCLAASFLLLRAIDGLIDGEAIDGYAEALDADQAELWQAALRAHTVALGQPVATSLG